MTLTALNTDPDIRDIEAGETYYVVADRDRGGRCVLNGCFIATWHDKGLARDFANSDPGKYTVVKSLKA